VKHNLVILSVISYHKDTFQIIMIG